VKPTAPLRRRWRKHAGDTLKHAWMISPFSRPPFDASIDRALWYGRFIAWCRRNDCPVSPSRFDVYEDALIAEKLVAPVDYFEFGVYQGESLRWWLSRNGASDSRFYGFDSFTGLPEPWHGYDAGHFQTEPPQISDERCQLVVGLFQDTLPEFFATHRRRNRQIIFMDADLFSATNFVLQHVGPRLRAGDILAFDEFHVWMHEFRAFAAFQSAFPIRLRAVRRSRDWSQIVMVVAEAG
jgi:hypothetical protein